MPEEAVRSQHSVIAFAKNEVDLWQEFNRCLSIAGKNVAIKHSCLNGIVGNVAAKIVIDFHQPEEARAAIAKVSPLLSGWKLSFSAQTYHDMLSGLCLLALIAGDEPTFKLYNNEVRMYYTVTQPNPYLWATHLARIGPVVEKSNPSLATALYVEFERSQGASCYWRKSAYPGYAAVAHRARNTEAEQMFLTQGRACAASFPGSLHNFELFRLDEMRKSSDFRGLEKAYGAAIQVLRKENPGYLVRLHELALKQAGAQVAQKNLTGARATLRDALKEARAIAAGAPNSFPCFYGKVLEASAALASSAGACKEADEIRAEASTLRGRCNVSRCTQISLAATTWCDGPTDAQARATNACRVAPPDWLASLP